MAKGLIIAKDGFNVSGSVADDYVNTETPLLKVAQRGQSSISYVSVETNTTKNVVINHGLGYRPHVQAFAERSPNGSLRLVQSTSQVASTDTMTCVILIEKQTFTLRFLSTAVDPTGSYRYFYYIFLDKVENDQ